MRFWDTSAIVPLMIAEPGSGGPKFGFGSDSEIIVWTLTRVELLSALTRRRRERREVFRRPARRPSRFSASLGWVVGNNGC